MSFSKDFLWGAASAAAQVEGGWNEGGRSPSIWDIAPDDKIKHSDNCHTACDTYHRYKEDTAIMKELGFKSYRFSISWSRVIAQPGKVNAEGVKYYSDLVDELLKAGIEPMVTLYHWDLPVWMHMQGGWYNETISDKFAFYTKAVVDALGDRVTWWMTFNEPQVFMNLGYLRGIHAPFMASDIQTVKVAARNVMLAHGKACRVIRESAKKPAKISFANAAGCWAPTEETPEKIEAARWESFERFSGVSSLSFWGDPLCLGVIPEKLKNVLTEEDMKIIHQPLDYMCINNYQSRNFADAKDYTSDGKKVKNPQQYPGMPRTCMDWSLSPEGLYWLTRFYYERYGKPVMVTENGMAENDWVCLDGKVHDPRRTDYITRYLANLKRAADEGIPVLGYQYWTLLDNFEWASGYDPRFGLVYVDFRDGKRIIKDSGYDYAEIIKTNGEKLPSWEIANKR